LRGGLLGPPLAGLDEQTQQLRPQAFFFGHSGDLFSRRRCSRLKNLVALVLRVVVHQEDGAGLGAWSLELIIEGAVADRPNPTRALLLSEWVV
jgi:hypothetical protein